MAKVKVIQLLNIQKEVIVDMPDKFLEKGWSEEAQLKVDLLKDEDWTTIHTEFYDQEVEIIAP